MEVEVGEKLIVSCNHCKHTSNVVLCSYPPTYVDYCCFCGDMWTHKRSYLVDISSNHGKFLEGRLIVKEIVQGES